MLSILELKSLGYSKNENVLKMECLSLLYWLDNYMNYKTGELLFDRPIAEVKPEVLYKCRENIATLLTKANLPISKDKIINIVEYLVLGNVGLSKEDFKAILKGVCNVLLGIIRPIEDSHVDLDNFKNDLDFVLHSIFPSARNIYLTAESYGVIKNATTWYALEDDIKVPITLVEEEVKYTEARLRYVLK